MSADLIARALLPVRERVTARGAAKPIRCSAISVRSAAAVRWIVLPSVATAERVDAVTTTAPITATESIAAAEWIDAVAAADVEKEITDVRILDDRVGHSPRRLNHLWKRRALGRAHRDAQLVVVLLGNKPFGYDTEHSHRGEENPAKHDEHRQAVPEHEAEAAPIAMEERVEEPFHHTCEASRLTV